MSMKPAKIQFNGGELSPWLAARTDIAKYDKTAKLCRNFIPLTEGSLKRRGGTCFVAQTPYSDHNVNLRINPMPEHAEVLINHAKTNSITIPRADTVFYEVRAKGYVSASGKVTLVANTTLEVKLVSQVKRHTLTITTTPANARVKINGVKRNTYEAAENEEVSYIVYQNYCLPQHGTLSLTEDKTLHITLVQDIIENFDYGDWGEVLAFKACTLYGDTDKLKKCFLICFENGYFPVLFDIGLKAPRQEDFDESRFIYDATQGYNAIYKNDEGVDTLAVMRFGEDGIFYDDLSGKALCGFDFATLKSCGLFKDSQDAFEGELANYDSFTINDGVKVCYNGEVVWALKGRNNG